MRLDDGSLREAAHWAAAGCDLPAFDRSRVVAATREAPEWIHFGAGNIFRALPAAIAQRLLDSGKSRTGLVVAEGFDPEIIEKAYHPFDNLSLLVLLRADGSIGKRVIASVVDSLVAEPSGPDWQRLEGIFRAPSLRLASLTITEKGYSLRDGRGGALPEAARDLAGGPAAPATLMGKLCALLLGRYRHGATPLALVSLDNCSRNGDRLREAMLAMTGAWVEGGLAEPAFADYLRDPSKVSFPWTMIDKITPRPDEKVAAMLEASGFEDAGIIVTSKGTCTAAFVNAEESEYLVIEDSFPNGRPRLESGGVIMTDRVTVERAERMKVSTCLNPLHTCLAVFGCLLGHATIHDAMRDPDLAVLVRRLGYEEGLPVAVDPGIIPPRAFLREVLESRLPNPFLPDTPWRIATDTSQKLAVRFGETIKAYLAGPGHSAAGLRHIPLVLAAWCRYLMGVDDSGRPFEPSPDPRLAEVRAYVSGIALGDAGPFHERLEPLLSDASIFGVDLCEAGLDGMVEDCFAELCAGPGAVRATLGKRLAAGA